MKLGKKISLIAISVILVMMSLVIYLMVQVQASTMRSADEEQTRQALHVLVSNMVSAADFQGEGYRDSTIPEPGAILFFTVRLSGAGENNLLLPSIGGTVSV